MSATGEGERGRKRPANDNAPRKPLRPVMLVTQDLPPQPVEIAVLAELLDSLDWTPANDNCEGEP